MRNLLFSVVIGGAILALSGCGGGGTKEVVKDAAFYTKKLNELTSIKSLHSDKTVILTMNSLEKTLNDTLGDVNSSSIAEIVYQVHRSLERKVENVDRFTFNKSTAFILKKPSVLQEQAQVHLLSKAPSRSKELDLNYELDNASRKIIGRSISATLPDNFSELLNNNEDIDESNSTQAYISFAPTLPKKIACPPSGACRKNSPMDKWQRGGLAEVQKLRQEYHREITDVINDNNATTRALVASNVRSSRTWSCPSYGYTITAVNYVNGTSAIDFMSNMYLYSRVSSTTSYEPFATDEGFDILQSPNNNSQESICLTNGYWIPSNETYYVVKKSNNNGWANTSSHWEGATNLNLTDIENAAQALSLYRFKLSAHANGPLPSGCGDIECTSSGSSMPDGSEEPIDPSGRMRMADIAYNNPELSGQDIFNLFRGDAWGTHAQDIHGLTLNWITTLDNLGIINGPAIAQNIRDRWNSSNGTGTFIFKKLEVSHNYTFDLVPIDEDVEELLLLPRQAHVLPGSFPSNLMGGGTPQSHVIMPFGRPNLNYCAESDPASNSYIPLYMVDPKVLMELSKDVEYLTVDQLDRIEDEKNINIWQQYNDLNISYQSYGYQSVPTLSYPPRIQYNCHETTHSRDGSTIPIVECDTKDEAYYDALIDRLIILNPTLNGSKTNHPCLGALNPWLPSF